jgi:hypothetical protein
MLISVGQISIRQRFRLDDEEHYTIFDVPISVTNSIESSNNRPPCDILVNEMLSPEEIDVEAANEVGVLFAPGDATRVEFDEVDGGVSSLPTIPFVTRSYTDDWQNDGNSEDNGLGGPRPEAQPSDGLGSGAPGVGRSWTGVFAGAATLMALLALS